MARETEAGRLPRQHRKTHVSKRKWTDGKEEIASLVFHPQAWQLWEHGTESCLSLCVESGPYRWVSILAPEKA